MGEHVKDKRRECNCHWECTWEPHPCTNTCEWPSCLTEEEQQEVLQEIIDADE